MTWEDYSVSDVVLAALVAATNLEAHGFAREFKKILQTPKAEWFAETNATTPAQPVHGEAEASEREVD